jgi:hypothetical protein
MLFFGKDNDMNNSKRNWISFFHNFYHVIQTFIIKIGQHKRFLINRHRSLIIKTFPLNWKDNSQSVLYVN